MDESDAAHNRSNDDAELSKSSDENDFMGRNAFDSFSTTHTPLIGERSNIASSTLIEDVPHITNNQFNRINLPLENGQLASLSPVFGEDPVRDTASNYPDEASSSQSREKPINPFAINTDSSVVNYSAHLQRAKSLFTNRSYVSPRLKNYRMRNPRSSLYRSTSSLCDNNSVSSNASSAMSSPFYNGQTTFGGASATCRRISTPNQDLLLHHRPKIPTNLVTSRSTSSLNSIGGSTSMSTTAKRILDVMSRYNTPLTEVRRISNALPSIAETSAMNKRKSILELDTITNEMDRTKRSLMKPNTPYNRPFGRNPMETALTTELHVPSMPELLQLKKFAANTMKIREIASNSDSALNKITTVQPNEFKITKNSFNQAIVGDLDTSNNNKLVNNKNNAISISANDTNRQDKYKIRNNINNKRRAAKPVEMPEPVNLPNISLVSDKKAEIKFTDPFNLANSNDKTTASLDNGIQIPFRFKSSNKNTSFAPDIVKEKRTNGNGNEVAKKFETIPAKPLFSAQTTTFNFNARTEHTVDAPVKPQPTQNIPKSQMHFRFAEPIVVRSALLETSMPNHFGSKFDFKFSEPTFVSDKPGELSKTEVNKSLSTFKFDPNPIKGITSDSGIAETTQSFDSNASKSSGLFVTKPIVSTAKDNGFTGKTVSSISTQWKDDDTSKQIDPTKKAAAAIPIVDDVFKAIVKKQKSSWECSDCFAQNDLSKSKCQCCNNPAPNSSLNPSTNAVPNVPSSSSKPVVDDMFKAIVNKQKSSWSCSACMATNDASKSKCVCCEQSREVTAGATESNTVSPKSQFSFGAPASKSSFSFGSNPSGAANVSSGFSFGNLPAKTNPAPAGQFVFGNLKSNESLPASTAIDCKTEDKKAKEPVQKPATSSAQFSFGNKTTLPSTSSAETTIKPPNVPVATDDIFKSIANKQKSASWECDSCMTKNSNDVEKCACCETLKPGSTPKVAEKKDSGLPANSSFSFGSPSGTFAFGSKPDNKPSFQFGSLSNASATTNTNASATKTTTETAVTAAPSVTTSAMSSVFGSSSQNTGFVFSAPKPATESSTMGQTPLGGFQFSFGSAAKTPTFGSTEISKDVTDTGPSTNTSNKSVTVIENVLVKPATNGPNQTSKPMFAFGATPTSPSTDDQPSQAKKRPNTDQSDQNVVAKLSTPSTGAFIFGQPQSVNNTFSAIASNPVTNVSQESSPAQPAQKPTFAFGTSKPSNNTFPTGQPSFTSTPFSFSAPSPATTTAPNLFGAPASATNTTSPPTFGSNAFGSNASTLPTLGGFKAGASFGSTAPAFGTTSPNTEAQPAPSQLPGLFQFGASNASVTTPLSSEAPKMGGFNFSVNSAPTFNFSEQSAQQQSNIPFQFGSAAAAESIPNIFSAQPTTAIQQRRKLRPVRRVNRP